MQIDWDIITKMNALVSDFKDEAEKQIIEADRLLDIRDYRGYCAAMRKSCELTKRLVDVRMMEVDIYEKTYNLVQNRMNGIEE